MNTENRNDSNICVIWTRVSTKHQETNGGSLDHQRTICEDYAKERGFIIKGYYGGKHETSTEYPE